MNIEEIKARQSAMESARGTWEATWQRVAELVIPRQASFQGEQAPGTNRSTQQYDAFAGQALDRFSSVILAGLIPRESVWHPLSTGDPELDERDGVREYLEALSRELWAARYSPRANFPSQAHEKILSLGAFGTGCMLIDPRPGGGIVYRNIPLSEVYIDDNDEGIVDVVHRRFSMSARQAVATFGPDTPADVISDYNAGKAAQRYEFLHVVAPREDFDPEAMDQRAMPFEGAYLFKGRELVRTEGYYENPYIVSRYTLSPGEKFGRGPGVSLLADIAMANEMKRTTIEVANMQADPPTLLHEDVSEFDLIPGARNLGAIDDNGNRLAVPWDSGGNPAIGLDMIQSVQRQVDDGFLGAYFRVLLDNPNMTATQATLLAQQQGQMTSPVVGRLQSEWLDPMIRRESGILFRQGKHPEMPDVLKEFLAEQDDGVKIEYESPLTRAAKSEEAIGAMRTFEMLAPLAQVDPGVMGMFDFRGIARTIARVNGVPASVMASKEEMAEADAQQQQEAAMQQVLAAAPVAADTAKKLAEAQAVAQASPAQVAR